MARYTDDDIRKASKITCKMAGERLIAYKYGKITEVQVQGIEKNLQTIIEQFQEMKNDLVFILSEDVK